MWGKRCYLEEDHEIKGHQVLGIFVPAKLKKANHLAHFDDQDHQNRNFTVSKMVVTIILYNTTASITRAPFIRGHAFSHNASQFFGICGLEGKIYIEIHISDFLSDLPAVFQNLVTYTPVCHLLKHYLCVIVKYVATHQCGMIKICLTLGN